MDEMNGKEVGGEEIEIVLAKPPDKKRKERQAARQTTRNTGWGGADTWLVDFSSGEEFYECNTVQLFAGMTITTIIHPHVCPHQAEAEVVVVEGATLTHQTIMDTKTTMMTTMVTTIMITVEDMKTLIMVMMMCTAWGAVVLVPAGGDLLPPELVELHYHVAGVAMPKEVCPSVVRGVVEEGGASLSNRRGAAVLAG